MHTVTFNVDDVTPEVPSNYYNSRVSTPLSIFTQLLKENSDFSFSSSTKPLKPKAVFEAVIESDTKYCPTLTNSFFQACHDAYAKHYPLELWVDHVKLTITQAFAIHVNENHEQLRELLVNHEGKKNITIRRDDFIRGETNPWTEVFSEFANKIKDDVKDNKLVDLIQSPTQTTTVETMAALNVSVMDIFQKYYDYCLMTRCGIPSICLKGSVEDWLSLKQLLQCMEKYDFKWYTDKMQTIVDEFVLAAKGTPNINFWKNMIKREGGSGGPYYHGWIKYMFPYLKNYKGEFRRSKFDDEEFTITSSCIPTGMSSVPVLWLYYNEKINLKFHTGFVGLSVTENNTIRPEVLWAIQDLDKTFVNYEIPSEFMLCYEKGIYYDPAGKHYSKKYGNDNCTVYCDMCTKVMAVGIGYGDNNDLCMDCVEIIKMKLNQ